MQPTMFLTNGKVFQPRLHEIDGAHDIDAEQSLHEGKRSINSSGETAP